MGSISTARLTITALSMQQLRQVTIQPERMAGEIYATLDPEAIGDASRRAIQVKLDKMDQAPVSAHPWYTYWLLVLREGKTGIGLAGFKGAPGGEGEVEIGYGISPAFQGRGYMTEAVQALVRWAFEQPGCASIRAETLRSNLPSQRVLQKTGFQRVRETQFEIYWRIRRAAIGERAAQNERPLAAGER